MLTFIFQVALAQIGIELLGAVLLVLIAVCTSWKKGGIIPSRVGTPPLW